MSNLPDFASISDTLLRQEILNFFENQANQIAQLTKALELANQEIARLKGQPKKPHFSSSNQSSISVTGLLKDKRNWKKKAKDVPVDQHVKVPEQEVCECGSKKFRFLRTKTKVVQGMIIKRNNIAYHGREKQCVNCGKIYKSSFPKGSFDSTLQALMSQLKFDGRFSHLLTYRFLRGFNIQISYGEITEIIRHNSNKLLPALNHLKTKGVSQSSFLQSDATGAKRRLKNGKVINQHLNFLGHKLLSIFKITGKYNALEMNKLLGVNGRKKLLVSDDGSPNNACTCKGLQLCLVHEIRLYKKLFPFLTPHQKLQQKILFEWRQFYHLAKEYGSDPPETATLTKREEIENMFDRITQQMTGYNDLDKQLRLSLKKKPKLLYFLDHPEVPIQNNESELSLREGVIMREISGPTKSVAGDRSIERHLSVIQTIKKQGLPVFETLHGLLTGQLSPAILTLKIV